MILGFDFVTTFRNVCEHLQRGSRLISEAFRVPSISVGQGDYRALASTSLTITVEDGAFSFSGSEVGERIVSTALRPQRKCRLTSGINQTG